MGSTVVAQHGRDSHLPPQFESYFAYCNAFPTLSPSSTHLINTSTRVPALLQAPHCLKLDRWTWMHHILPFNRGDTKTLCRRKVTAHAWMDSNSDELQHSHLATGSVLRRQKDGSRVAVPCPESIIYHHYERVWPTEDRRYAPCFHVDFGSFRTPRSSSSIPTETHGKDSSSQLLQLPWTCVAYNTLFPCSHAKFHGVRSELQYTYTVHVAGNEKNGRDKSLEFSVKYGGMCLKNTQTHVQRQ